MIRRIQRAEQIRGIAPALAELCSESTAPTPNFRPVTAEEIVRKASLDPRLAERLIYVWMKRTEALAWCSAEPVWQPNIGGDIYPYVGGEIAFQPSVIFVRPDWRDRGIAAEILDQARRDLAAQGKRAMQVIVSEGDEGGAALYEEAGFSEIARMVSLRAGLREAKLDLAHKTTRRLRDTELRDFLETHNAAFEQIGRLHGWEAMTPEQFELLRQTVTGYDDRGVFLAGEGGEVGGYVTAMVDPVFNQQHGTRRGWIGCAQLGLTIGPRHQGRGLGQALMAAAMVYLAGRQMREAELVTSAGSDQALAFYTSFGFEPVREWPVLEATAGTRDG